MQPTKNANFINGVIFNFYHCGEWIEIDTGCSLPRQIGTKADDGNLWISLVEKAYAKLYDNYMNLSGGLTSFTMCDLTGGVGIHNRLDGISWSQLTKFEDGRSK